MASRFPDPLSIRDVAWQYPNDTALVAAGRSWTYAQAWDEVKPIYEKFRRASLGTHHLVALTATNRPETLWILYALLLSRVPAVLLHPRLTASESRTLLEDCQPDVVLWDRSVGQVPTFSGSFRRRARFPRGTALVMYTSGTTGRAKGAILTRRNLITSALASAANLGFEPSDRWGCCLPICHIGGLSILTRCLIARKPLILFDKFCPDVVMRSILADRMTLLSVVPTLLVLLLEHPQKELLQKLRVILVGGAPMPIKLYIDCIKLGLKAFPTYGMTEVCSQVVTWDPREMFPADPQGVGIGRPLPGVKLRLCADGAEGEIQVRGPMVSPGYLGEPCRPAGQWFSTGDIGRWDEQGRLIVLARRTDLIITGGENVYPAEVEQALSDCRGIKAAMVYGVTDPVWGQVVAVDVVVENGLGVEEIRRYSESVLAKHKRPKIVRVVEKLPVGSTGKPVRPRAGVVEPSVS